MLMINLVTLFGLCFRNHIGMSVNKLRKKCGGTELFTVAKKLIKSWKKLLWVASYPGYF